MRTRTILQLLAVILTSSALPGCCEFCHGRNSSPTCPPGAACPPSPGLPPVGAIPAPPGAAPVPFPPGVPATPPAPAPVPEMRSFGPAATPDNAYGWQPADNNVRLSPPIAATPGPEPKAAQLPPQNSSAPAKMPTGPATIEAAPVLPVGIPQFVIVKERKIANGLRPMLDDGLDWLRANGYRTVLHLRRPGEDDTADRKQVEKRGLNYLSIEVGPESLTRKTVEGFSRMVNDAANYPLFVYDRDGSLAGALWYLHFRLSERDTDDTARIRASQLGLHEDREGNHRAMWLAIQKLLSE